MPTSKPELCRNRRFARLSPNPSAMLSRSQMPETNVELNHLPGALLEVLPPTDSRLRPDIRAIELGQYAKVVVHS